MPESVGRERNRAAKASNSGHGESEISIFSLPAMCRAIATISAVPQSHVATDPMLGAC
jgi:hypothetical protein